LEPGSAYRTLDLVVIARQAITEVPFLEVEADFRAALGKLRGVKYSA
jgi:RNase P protein component